MDIGAKLKSLRIEKGFEPLDLAEKLNISETTYRRYERNESAPDLNMLEKISKVYEIEIKDLLKDDSYTFYNHKNKGDNIMGNIVINNLSDKLIEQYETRLKEKDRQYETHLKEKEELINELKAEIKKFKD